MKSLQQWMDIYDQMKARSSALNLDEIEQELAACLQSERETSYTPYPSDVPVQIEFVQISGGEMPEEHGDEVLYTVYVRQRGCPYFTQAKEVLDRAALPYQILDLDTEVLPQHATQLKHTKTSPQIFANDRLIDGGAEGLARHLAANAHARAEPRGQMDVHTQNGTPKWFLYGWEACGACQHAWEIIGENNGAFISIFEQTPDQQWKRKSDESIQLHPVHAKLLGTDQLRGRVRQHILDATAVPVLFFGGKAEQVDNDATLERKVKTWV